MKAKRRQRKAASKITSPDSLSPKQLAKYEDSLHVLDEMRDGKSIKTASKQVSISPSTVKKYVGSALYLKQRRLVAKKSDNLLRNLRIYENGGEFPITVRGSKQVKIIAQYHSEIGRLHNDRSALVKFKKITIKDVYGKTHRLETNTVKIFAILERRENAEFFSIYAR